MDTIVQGKETNLGSDVTFDGKQFVMSGKALQAGLAPVVASLRTVWAGLWIGVLSLLRLLRLRLL